MKQTDTQSPSWSVAKAVDPDGPTNDQGESSNDEDEDEAFGPAAAADVSRVLVGGSEETGEVGPAEMGFPPVTPQKVDQSGMTEALTPDRSSLSLGLADALDAPSSPRVDLFDAKAAAETREVADLASEERSQTVEEVLAEEKEEEEEDSSQWEEETVESSQEFQASASKLSGKEEAKEFLLKLASTAPVMGKETAPVAQQEKQVNGPSAQPAAEKDDTAVPYYSKGAAARPTKETEPTAIEQQEVEDVISPGKDTAEKVEAAVATDGQKVDDADFDVIHIGDLDETGRESEGDDVVVKECKPMETAAVEQLIPQTETGTTPLTKDGLKTDTPMELATVLTEQTQTTVPNQRTTEAVKEATESTDDKAETEDTKPKCEFPDEKTGELSQAKVEKALEPDYLSTDRVGDEVDAAQLLDDLLETSHHSEEDAVEALEQAIQSLIDEPRNDQEENLEPARDATEQLGTSQELAVEPPPEIARETEEVGIVFGSVQQETAEVKEPPVDAEQKPAPEDSRIPGETKEQIDGDLDDLLDNILAGDSEELDFSNGKDTKPATAKEAEDGGVELSSKMVGSPPEKKVSKSKEQAALATNKTPENDANAQKKKSVVHPSRPSAQWKPTTPEPFRLRSEERAAARPVREAPASTPPRDKTVWKPTVPKPFHFASEERAATRHGSPDARVQGRYHGHSPEPESPPKRASPIHSTPTTPEPFHFMSEERAAVRHCDACSMSTQCHCRDSRKKDSPAGGSPGKENTRCFRARPMPKFEHKAVLPSVKPVTVPQPFHLSCDERLKSRRQRLEDVHANEQEKKPWRFKARPMPKFA